MSKKIVQECVIINLIILKLRYWWYEIILNKTLKIFNVVIIKVKIKVKVKIIVIVVIIIMYWYVIK